MRIEHSQILACFLHHFITFFFRKIQSRSVKFWWSGSVLKDLNLLGPLVHYLACLEYFHSGAPDEDIYIGKLQKITATFSNYSTTKTWLR